MAAVLGRLLDAGRKVLPALVCALSAHALAYRSFVPHDAVHGYLGAYEAVVAVASTISLAAVLYASVLVLSGRRHRLARVLAPAREETPAPIGYRALSIALWAYAVLAVQEAAEALVGAALGQPIAFSLGSWLVAVSALAASATALTLLGHSYRRVLLALLAVRLSVPRAPGSVATRVSFVHPARRKPLADFRALRAPPLLHA